MTKLTMYQPHTYMVLTELSIDPNAMLINRATICCSQKNNT